MKTTIKTLTVLVLALAFAASPALAAGLEPYLVRDLPGNGDPRELSSGAGILYFTAFDGASHWLASSDGTEAGTSLSPRPAGTTNATDVVAVGESAYFVSGGDLYYGTPDDAERIFAPTFNVARLARVGESLYFVDNRGAGSRLLYRATDRSVSGPFDNCVAGGPFPDETLEIADLEGEPIVITGGAFSYDALWNFSSSCGSVLEPGLFRDLATAGGRTYAVKDPNELWATSGGSASFLQGFPSGLGGLVPSGDQVFFRGDLGSGPSLWAADSDGIRAISGPSAADLSQSGTRWATVGETTYFTADRQLWKTDGTTATLVFELPSGPSNAFGELIAAGGDLFYTANDGGGPALWILDPRDDSTERITEPSELTVQPASGSGRVLATVGSLLFFIGQPAGASDWELHAVEFQEPGLDGLRSIIESSTLPNPGLRNSFLKKLENAQKLLEVGRNKPAGNVLCALALHGGAQAGKGLDGADAAEIHEIVQEIRGELLGLDPICPCHL